MVATRIAGLTLVGLLCCGVELRGENPRLVQEIERLWEQEETRKADALEAEDRQFRSVSAELADWRHDFAHVLLQVAQYRYEPAGEEVAALLERRADDWRLRRTKAWLSLAMRQYEQGLVELDLCVKSLPVPADERDLEGREAALDIGRMVGFLEHAAPYSNGPAVSRFVSRWQLLLTPARREAMDQARAAVKSEVDKLQGDREALVNENRAKAEKLRTEQLAALDEQRDGLAKERDQLGVDSSGLRRRLDMETASADRADAPLRDQAVRLENRAVALDRDLIGLTNDIARLERRLVFERDPLIRATLEAELRRLDAAAAQVDAELLAVERELDLLGLRRGEIAVRLRRLQAELGDQLARMDQRRDEIARLDRRLNAQKQRLLRSTAEVGGGARSLAARAAILATYLPFPLAEEKQRLMALAKAD